MSDPGSRQAERVGIARHGRLRQQHPVGFVVRIVATVLAVALVSAGSVAAIAVGQLRGNIDTVALVGEEEVAPPPAIGQFEGGFNMLIVGSDQCEQEGGCADRESKLNDVNILLHVAADQTTATAVSFPRDLVVPIPSCPMEDGSGSYNSMSAQPINVTLSYGGLACTVLTVEALTGLDIPYAGLITFNGVIEMSNAVGGVPVCINAPIVDRYSGLNLPEAGTYTLQGIEALAFLRSRHGVGDGSDLGRISSQQVYMSSLIRTIKDDSTLSDVTKLYSLATAATSNMTLSNSLANLSTLVSMSLVLKDIPLEQIMFVQYPGTTGVGGVYAGKVSPLRAQATDMFDKIRADEPFALAEGSTGQGAEIDPNAPVSTPVPAEVDPSASASAVAPATPEVLTGVLGQTAADYTCSVAFGTK